MRTKHALLIMALAPLILASCTGSGSNDASVNVGSPRNATTVSGNQQMPRYGSGSRFGSGGMMRWNMMGQLSPEDQELFRQMMDARRDGNQALFDQIQGELQEKYPNLRFGFGGRRNGSGSTNSGSYSSGSAR